MNNFLVATYSLRIKKIYDDIKEDIPAQLTGTLKENRESITKFVIASIKKAYKEGVENAKAYPGFQDVKENPKISNTDIKQLFSTFFVYVKNAENILKMRIKNERALAKNYGHRLRVKGNPQIEQAVNEYNNAIKNAVNNIIINSGFQGQISIWEQ